MRDWDVPSFMTETMDCKLWQVRAITKYYHDENRRENERKRRGISVTDPVLIMKYLGRPRRRPGSRTPTGTTPPTAPPAGTSATARCRRATIFDDQNLIGD
jgi:hypothetical protein|eukprot:SAG25_NODE_58_length_18473_cov_99.552846_17_plen_101_part_00